MTRVLRQLRRAYYRARGAAVCDCGKPWGTGYLHVRCGKGIK